MHVSSGAGKEVDPVGANGTAVGGLTGEQVRAVLLAVRQAPPRRARCPWRLVCTPGAIELHASPVTAAADRDLLLACGAALLNLRLAIHALAVHPGVRLFPDPHRKALLAVITPLGPAASGLLVTTGRRPPLPLVGMPPQLLATLRQAARSEQAWMAALAPSELIAPGTPDTELIAVIGTFHDGPSARLQAGQATHRVMLTAAAGGLTVATLPRLMGRAATRRQLRARIGGGLWPQAVLRLGAARLS